MSQKKKMKTLAITEKTKISRSAKRGSYEIDTINAILDEGLFCHIAYEHDGQPMMIPTAYCRINDKIYIHGSVGSHFMRMLAEGKDICFVVSLIDGLVLARSAFHHSVNYRSVIAFAKAEVVTDEDERWNALEQITEHLVPNRWADVREPYKNEMQKTMILSFTLDEASAKIRTGDPIDDEEDYALPVWAGILPLKVQASAPIPDPRLIPSVSIPEYLHNYKRGEK